MKGNPPISKLSNVKGVVLLKLDTFIFIRAISCSSVCSFKLSFLHRISKFLLKGIPNWMKSQRESLGNLDSGGFTNVIVML